VSLLVSKLAAAAAPPAKVDSLFAQRRAATPRGAFVEMAFLGNVWVEMPGDMVVAEIEGAVLSQMEALKLPPTAFNAAAYGSRRLALTLAWSVRHPNRIDERAGSAADWCALDVDMLSVCGLVYNDVRERLSPLSSDALTADEIDAIRLGIEKKNRALLLSCGVVALSNWLLTGAVQPASSPTTQSSIGES
jgi:hypothetical protein